MHTQHGDVILRSALEAGRQAGIILPIFKEIKDKNLLQPYIEKSQPIIYHSQPDRNVVLHYRARGAEGYFPQKMKYVGFGVFTGHFIHFYGEDIEYYIEESIGTGSIATQPQIISNNRPHLLENPGDLYYTINNALIFEQMFKYEQVEEIITARLEEGPQIRAKLM